jgi:Pretoxin HINT domain/HEAT repeats
VIECFQLGVNFRQPSEEPMVHAILLCFAMLGDGGKPAETTPADRAAYEAAQAKAGKNAAAHVQLALWCEAHRLTAERITHLTEAVSLDPSNLLARGLLGLVAFQGKWTKPDQVRQEIQSDPKLQALRREYLARRVHTPQKPDAQLRLAAWCQENGLSEEAMVHYYGVTRLDPSRDIAWIKLGYKKHKDRWVKPDDLAAQKLEAELQKRADSQWKLRLEKLREAMESTNETRRLKAERELYKITDPRAVPMIWKLFGNGSEKTQLLAVELLAQIEGPTASFWLAVLAVDKPSSEVRSRAARALAHRDPRDVIGWLITLIHKPFKYELKPASGAPGSTATLMIDGERLDLRRLYRFPDMDIRLAPAISYVAGFGGLSGAADASTLVALGRLGAGLAAQSGAMISAATELNQQRSQDMQQTLENDIRSIEETNAQINQTNDRSLPLLETLTSQKFGVDPPEWRKWWTDQLGYVYDPKYDEKSTSTSQTVEEPDLQLTVPSTVVVPHTACFAAGTSVQTIAGPRRIETIEVGDRVLSQHPSTGELSYRPVLATHRNGPAATLRIAIDGETLVATGIHRFWKAGTGWTMARDLLPGDRLRMFGGTSQIQSIEPGANQTVYNLDVAENRNFLVGSAGLLVHDFSFVQPVSEPFDRQTNPVPAAHK